MPILLEFLPILLFFIAYKACGIYIATAVAIVVSLIQITISWLVHRYLDKLQIVTCLLIICLGSATLLFHNELFIKWKPTAINWAFGLIFLASQWFYPKPLIQTLMQSHIQLPESIWRRLNLAWASFFIFMGSLNLLIIYHCDTNTWVNFKLFGILGLTGLFIVLQTLYLMRHMQSTFSKT